MTCVNYKTAHKYVISFFLQLLSIIMGSRRKKIIAMATIDNIESDLEDDAWLKVVDSFLVQNSLDTEINGAESNIMETNLAAKNILYQEACLALHKPST